MTCETAKRLVSVADVHQATGIDPDTIRGHLDRKEWPGVKIGAGKGLWRLPAAVIDYLLAGKDPREMTAG